MLLQPFGFGVLLITISISLILGKQPGLVDMYVAFSFLLLGGVLSISSLVELYKRIFIFCTGDNSVKELLVIKWNKTQARLGSSLNIQYSHLYIGLNSKFNFDWNFMYYDGLPLWSLRLGYLHLSGGDCHEWVGE
jgi:hypothetical protein